MLSYSSFELMCPISIANFTAVVAGITAALLIATVAFRALVCIRAGDIECQMPKVLGALRTRFAACAQQQRNMVVQIEKSATNFVELGKILAGFSGMIREFLGQEKKDEEGKDGEGEVEP